MIHQIIPCKERESQIIDQLISNMHLGQPESLLHALFFFDSNRDAAMHLLDLTRIFDNSITQEKTTSSETLLRIYL